MILDAYLHLDRYQEATAFAEAMGFPESQRAWLEERAARPPTVRLNRTTVVPFAEDNFLGDLMPAVMVELNGTRLVAHLDTGVAFITMSGSRARELGIEVREVGTGVANNQRTSVSNGLADSLTIGDAALTNVEVATVESLTGQLESFVILGTRILSSFLTTWDNGQSRLILTPRGDVAARSRHLAEHTVGVEGTDLYLRGDHFLWVNGNVDGQDTLMFLDTGLVTPILPLAGTDALRTGTDCRKSRVWQRVTRQRTTARCGGSSASATVTAAASIRSSACASRTGVLRK